MGGVVEALGGEGTVRLVCSLLVLSASCACPSVSCPASIKIELTSPAWPQGVWVVQMTGDGLDARCTILVEAAGEAPAVQDIGCGDAGLRAGALDTGWSSALGPLQIEARAGGDLGDVTLAVTRTAGQEVTSWTWTEAPAWREVNPPAGTCFVGCRAGDLALTLPPDRAPQP